MSIPITVTDRLIRAFKNKSNISALTTAVDIARSHSMTYKEIAKIAEGCGISFAEFDSLLFEISFLKLKFASLCFELVNSIKQNLVSSAMEECDEYSAHKQESVPSQFYEDNSEEQF